MGNYNMNDLTNTETYNDNKGLKTFLGSTEPAQNIITGHKLIEVLAQSGHADMLRTYQGLFTVERGDNVGDKIDLTDKIIIALLDNKFEPASLAIFDHRTKANPELTDPSQPYALILGDPRASSELYAAQSTDEGIGLYRELVLTQGLNAAVLVSLNSYHFNSMVKYYAKERQVTVTTTLDNKKSLVEPLKGINAKAIITKIIPLHDIMSYETETYASVMKTAEVIELESLVWPEPESLSSDPSTPTPYPINAWQGVLKNTVKKIAHYAQVPEAMAGQCVLGALSHMGQRFIDAPMGHGHMPASLYLITEGESGSGKTVAMKFSHYEIKNHEREQYQTYLDDLDNWELEKAGLKNSELKQFLAENPRPHNPITMFDDATIEPILDKFVDGQMNDASWSTDEAGQFFNGHTMKGDTAGNALGALTKLYSEGIASRTRSQKNQFASPRSQAYDVRMTLLMMGQRVILEQALTDNMMNEQGFLARALIACPEDLRGKRVWNDPQRRSQSPYDDNDLIAYWEKCRSLLDPSPINNPNYNGKGRIKVKWHDAQAEQAFYDGMQAIENRQAKGRALEYLKAYASRMAENASRIASLMAFFEGRYTITTDDINRAFKLVEYSTSERLRYLDATPSDKESDTEKLSKWLVSKAKDKKPHKLNRTYVSNYAPSPMRKSSKLLQIELDKLESAGHIRQEKEGLKRVILINPVLCA